MGFNVGRPNTVQLENDRTDNFLRNIRNNLKDTTQMVSLWRRGRCFFCVWKGIEIRASPGCLGFIHKSM